MINDNVWEEKLEEGDYNYLMADIDSKSGYNRRLHLKRIIEKAIENEKKRLKNK